MGVFNWRLQNYHKAYIFPIAVSLRECGVFCKTEAPHVHAADLFGYFIRAMLCTTEVNRAQYAENDTEKALLAC